MNTTAKPGPIDVSILVVAWNVRQLVYDCLKSVFAQTQGITFELIYVDNGSTDGTVAMVREQFPQVTIIENAENKGFIRANNQAIEVAQGRYVLLLNSDTVVLENAIEKTVRFADSHPEAAVVGCRVMGADGKLQENCFRFYSPVHLFFDATFLYKAFPQNKVIGRKHYAGWGFDSVREVDVVIGCYSLVRMAAIKQVGVMDEIFFVYGDDIDWCYRFTKSGWKILFFPGAQIVHYGGMNTKRMADKFALQLHGSVLIHVKRNYSFASFLLCRLLTAWYLFARGVYAYILALRDGKERAKILQSARAWCSGAYYCLFDWKALLMNREAVEHKL